MDRSHIQWAAAASTTLALATGGCSGGGSDESTAAVISECTPGQTDGNLALYNWSEYIDPEQLAAFGEEFGIAATMDVFDSNEAMQPIVAAGNSGYDVIVPSDYMVGIMIAGGHLAELNRDAIPNLTNLDPAFTGLDYDPDGRFSVPYQAGTTGIAVDTDVVGTDFERSWGLIFDPALSAEFDGRISLLNDPRETLGAALKYLGHSLNTTNDDELQEAEALVAATASRLAAFDTDSADEFLVSGETAISHGYSGSMFVQFLDTENPERYVYFVPEEGGTRWIDTMAITFDAPHPCTAHTFINWLLEADNGAELTNWNFYTTPNQAAKASVDPELVAFIDDPMIVTAGPDSLELIEDTGDFEIEYSDAFSAAKG